MKRVFTLGILIIICFVLQTALFPYIEIAGTAPDLMLILTVSFGLMRGRKEGMLVGFFCGFLYDLYFGYAIGPFMILYMILGYCNGFFHRLYLVEDVLLPMLIILIDDLFFNFATYIFPVAEQAGIFNLSEEYHSSRNDLYSIDHTLYIQIFCICEQDTKASGKSKRIRTGRKIQ